MDEPTEKPARDVSCMGGQRLRYQVGDPSQGIQPLGDTDTVRCRESYYLSSHHIDICCWFLQGKAVPTRVMASAATGIATGEPYNCVPRTEDTITLLVDWQSLTSSGHRGTAVYTASWTAPQNSGVHSAQHFYYMAEKVRIRSSVLTFHAFCSSPIQGRGS